MPGENKNELRPLLPESTVWLPGLSKPHTSTLRDPSSTSFSQTKTCVVTQGTKLIQNSHLYDVKCLPYVDALGLTSRSKQKKSSSVPRLPNIDEPTGTGSKPSQDSNGNNKSAADDTLGSKNGSAGGGWEEGIDKKGGKSTESRGEASQENANAENVKTGDDIIEFYGKYGQDSPIKFFYCNRANTGVLFRPYDLVVVSREKIDPEYYTISATGVMKIKKGVQAEFTPLSEFVRQKTMFSLLTTIRFFKNYLIGKFFRRWHKGVRRKNFMRIRSQITERLFLAKPTFCPYLMEIYSYVSELSAVSMAWANPNHLYQLDEYAELQVVTREQKAKPALETVVEKVQQVVERLCREVQKQARLYQESIRDVSELVDTTGVELFQGRSSGKNRSMIAIRKEKIERARTYWRVMEEERMLGIFIRLVDYLFVEGVMARAIESVSDLLQLLSGSMASNDKLSKGVFLTTINFSDTDICFVPDRDAITDILNTNVIEGVINVAQQAPRILFMRAFAHYFEGKPSGLNPVNIIRNTPEFINLRQRINKTVLNDFTSAKEYVKIFEDYRKIYSFGRDWNFDEYAAKKPLTIRDIRRDMHKQREWRNDLEKMKISQVVGSLYVESKTLRNALMPITQNTLENIKGLLLGMARDSCINALQDITERVNVLLERPAGLEDFMVYQVMHKKQVEEKKPIIQKASQVDDMYEMLAIYEQKVPTADQVKHDDLKEALTKFVEELRVGKEFLADHKASQIDTLQTEINDVNEELMATFRTLNSGIFTNSETSPAEASGELETILGKIENIRTVSETYKEYQQLFDLNPDDFSNLAMVETEAKSRYDVWKSLHDFLSKSTDWTDRPILTGQGQVRLDIEVVRKEVDEYSAKAYKLGKANKEDQVIFRLKDSIDAFKNVLPIVEELSNPALKTRHWAEIFRIVGCEIETTPDGAGFEDFSVQDLLGHKILDKLEAVQILSTNASKEYSLEKALEKMKGDWDGVEFRVIEYKDTGTFIIGGTDEIQALLDDQIVKIQSMCASPFIAPLEQEAGEWNDLLNTLQDMLDNWMQCQATWQYLEPIFSSPDIMKQMPEEGEKFLQVDQQWREMMESSHETPSCLVIARDKERLANLEENNRLLDEIQKGLAAYLEVKRIAFPRFFFLSNDEMLEILSETKDPTKVQPHLKKCFEAIEKLRFEPSTDITGMISSEGELVPLKTKIKPKESNGAVEKWLVQVEAGMIESIHEVCTQGVESYPQKPRQEWVLDWPGQVVLVVTAIFWTRDVENAIQCGRAGGLKEVSEDCTSQLADIVNLVRGDLSKLSRMTLSALVVMDVHARDVVSSLAEEKIEGEMNHFSWMCQLRSYWESMDEDDPENKSIPLCMMNSRVEYGYEYLGNSSRLVVTPLTDRCYRTLMGAIHLNLGGAPEGPAGTGKTETTKDLAKALARQCVVFNCSDTLDYLTMAKFFKGLISSGAWACFDEFNRIDLEVLSVVAQQVLELQLAVKNKLKTVVFEGSELPVRPSCNAFITMNPGYAGRSELPDNLKALFRTVAMMVPDYALIAEIILYSNGYLKARDCARKIVATYKLCSEQLSSQDHYDYGMRAVVAVLRAAGNMKRKFPDGDEFVLTLRSIIDVNLCKFLSHDVPLFNSIVLDLFPGITLPEADYEQLNNAMRVQCTNNNLQPTNYFLMKTIQLYEMIIVRHGLMLVGQPFSGKSSSIKVLSGALSDLHSQGANGPLFDRVQLRIINPKSVTMGQLYGETDLATQEWKDGVLAVTFRQLASDPSPDRKWCVLDGPVDAIWIENMNTVLDDNKKLCLPNSEIIQMSGTMSMIFEVGDLAVASPATVSRCGMVYLEPHQLGWQPLMASWVNTLPEAILGEGNVQRICDLFNWLLPVCLRFVRREVKELSPTEDSNLAKTTMNTITSLLDEFQPADDDDDAPKPPGAAFPDNKKTLWVDSIFLFSIVWSVGCTTNDQGRAKFNTFLREIVAGFVPEEYEEHVKNPVTLMCPIMPEADGSTVYDFVFCKESSSWKLWTDTLGKMEIPAGAKFSDIIVPTKDSARYTFLLDIALKHKQPLLMVGPTGTGKSVYMTRHLVEGLPKESWNPVFITFSARTSAGMTQDQVDGRLDKRRKGMFGPPVGKRCVVFVDDINMPSKETYGAQPPIELLRQFMDYSGWYGSDNSFKQLVDVQIVAAMGPPGGGRTFLTNRYLRHFNTLALAQVSDDTLRNIFETILAWHFETAKFPAPIKKLSSSIINATLEIYSQSMEKLLPTPTKSHYVFNLRDLARVIQGMMMMGASGIPEDQTEATNMYKRLWVHEVFRVFYDRLVEPKDRVWLLDQVKSTTKSQFSGDFDGLIGGVVGAADEVVTPEDMRRCFFGDYMDADAEPDERKYLEVSDLQELLGVMEQYLMDHNSMSKRPMNLAMFLFAVEHVSRICRVLKQPGGHMLLVGVGGSGRQSLAKLAAFICGMEAFQVEISKSYGKVEWRDDLKKILQRAGGEMQPTVFLFSDTQIKDEAFVEDINNLLNSGEVPNMFPTDEKMQILELVRPAASKRGLETTVELWGYFVSMCKQNLHVILCVSPIGDAFRERLRQNPSLVNCCTIDWFTKWPTDALEAVAFKFLKDMDLEEEDRKNLVACCQAFHQKVQEISEEFLSDLGRHNYVTPTSYLELISMFHTLLQSSRAENTKLKNRYLVGLEKLDNSATQVAGMQKDLQALQPQLVKTVAEVEELMEKIALEKKESVEPKAAIVKVEEAKASAKAAEAKAIKDECEAELAEAIPILNDALSALDTIKEADINYIRKLGNPPGAIKLVMEAVCVILDVKPAKIKDDSGKTVPDFWKPSVGLMNEKDFLGKLKSYDKDNIPPKIIEKIRSTYITNEAFTPDLAKKASPAAEGMCKWVHAMSSYDKVAKVVAPKKEALKEAEGAYEEVMVGLRGKQAELKELLDKLAAMESDLEMNTTKKNELEAEVELCSVKLERAEKLIGGLGGEKTRWTETAERLTAAYTNLTGDMLISAGIIAYLGAFTAAYRQRISQEFLTLASKQLIPHSEKFSMANVLGEPVKIQEWMVAGLPNDTFSIENGIIVQYARRWPLMIDPQGQANKWIRTLEKTANLQVIKLSEGGEFLRVLENAIQFGLPVLLENVGEELDPSLEPLFLKQIFKSGGVNCIRLGDATIEYSSDFRFYITTKTRNPHYLPEIAVKVTLLNFMITPAGLSDQLLGVVVANERPDLEEQRNELVVQSATNARKLKEIEDKILEVLSSSEGNILEDETAIQIITEAKVLGNDIAEKQKLAEVTEKEIEKARVGYKPCGAYTAILFFCISDLANIDPMYQYSLNWFINLFVASLHDSEEAEDLQRRLSNIHDHFTYSLYCNVCRSLFEKDKLLFAFLLCSRILESRGKINQEEWSFLLTGGLLESRPPPNPASAWMVDKSWKEICVLDRLGPFRGLAAQFPGDVDEWKAMYDSLEPHKVPFPAPFQDLDLFRKLLIVRCLRPDKVVLGIADFVESTLGRKFVEPPPFNLQSCYNDSTPTMPLIFVLSPGSDPFAALLQFAAEKDMANRLFAISLGQGQGPKAAALIGEGVSAGNWVVLQNCHLAPSWMPSLDRICEEMDADSVSSDFRLWMTSYPSPKFPVNILQNGVKMTNEPPKGIRANMLRSYLLEPVANDDFFEGCKSPGPFKRLLFGLIFFHALVQERRKFGPLGWNIPYGFDDGDQRISVQQLRMFLDENDKIPFDALRYVTGECNYGGRVTDDKDRLLLTTALRKCYCPEIVDDKHYKLSSSGLYYALLDGERKDYTDYIHSLPMHPLPEGFGLHANADITKDQNDTALIFSSLLSLGGSGGGGGAGGGVEDRVAGIVRECMGRLPPNYDIEMVQNKYPVLYEESMNTVLAQEMVRFNKLLDVIKDSLKNIDLAIQGLLVMSSDLEKAFQSVSINQVPELWKKVSYPSMKSLGSYLEDLYARLKMLQDWYEFGAPKTFWLSGFFFVHSFLTAGLQNYARKEKLPIDMVLYDFQMLGMNKEAYTTGPKEGMYVYGLYLEGCGWDSEKNVLCESEPKVLFAPAPCMWLKPMAAGTSAGNRVYGCPVYRTAERRGVLATTGHSTNFVMIIKMPTELEASHWIMRGVALLSQLTD